MFLVVGGATTAQAEPDPTGRLADPAGLFTELRVSGLGAGSAVSAYDAPADMDPLAGYPATLPAGSVVHPVSFAGLIEVTDPINGEVAFTYCIDLFTETEVGVHYELGDWTSANVPNIGYVGYILHNYYPTTSQPSGTPDFQAAAVQLAIWFFTDRVVLDPSSPFHATVSQIVADALAGGPSPEPPQPQLSVTPEEMDAPSTGDLVGPFEVSGDGPGTLRTFGVEVFTDANGDNQLAEGDEVQPGTRLWVRSVSETEPQGFVLERDVDIVESSVYVYDGTNPDRETAQKLILAQRHTLTIRAGAYINRYDAGHLAITKTVAGSGAGFQGKVVIDVACVDPDGNPHDYSVTLDAKAAAGEHALEVRDIPAGSTCQLTESSDGDNDYVNVDTVTIDPESVTILKNDTVDSAVTNTYSRGVGALQLTKTITGPGAGNQGAITLRVSCPDPSGDVVREFTIAARSGAGEYAQPLIEGLPAGAVCTLTEPANGENGEANLIAEESVIEGTVTILDGQTVSLEAVDSYDDQGILPVTGAPVGTLLHIGAGLLTAGLVLALTSRLLRRRTAE